MPKGDKKILKADPDDGTTPVSNLLLEALAYAKLSGLERGALVYLWRRTYGWIAGKKKRRKERVIPLSEWTGALNTNRITAWKTLNSLEKKCVITLKRLGKGKSISYMTNTHIYEWACIDKELFAKWLTPVGQINNTSVSETANTVLAKSTIPLDTKLATPKETINKYLNKDVKESIPTTSQELEILALLQSVPGWVYEEEEDLEWLRELAKDYPNVELLLIKGCRDYFSDNPVKKGPWKNRIRQWLQHGLSFKEKKGGTHTGHSQKTFTDEEYEASIGGPLD